MRPALDGHAGIPQEARLLFRGLSLIDDVTVEGLIQSSGRILAEGLPAKPGFFSGQLTEDQRINRLLRKHRARSILFIPILITNY